MVTVKEMTDKHRQELVMAEAKGYQDGFEAGRIQGQIDARGQGIAAGIGATIVLGIIALVLWLAGTGRLG